MSEVFNEKFQEQEEPNDSEVEPNEDYHQQPPTAKVAMSEINSEPPQVSSTDEEAVNKVVEKIDTMRIGPRQVRGLESYGFD